MKRKSVFISFVLLYFGIFIVFILLPLSCSKDDIIPSSIPELTTNTISTITHSTANCGGNIISNGGETVTARGVCWSTSQNPSVSDSHTSDGSGTGNFTSSLSGLIQNTTYYVRAFATNSIGTAYGEEKSFSTIGLPSVTTQSTSNIAWNSAECGGNVTYDGGAAITARGVCWSTSQDPTIIDQITSDGTGTGSFVSAITGLSGSTTYYVRAYATNSVGTGYGNELSFTTEPECELLCDIGTESYSIGISCESGSTITTYYNQSTEYQYDSFGRLSALKLNLNQTRTYENTNNTYTIVGVIMIDLIQDTETHDITVSGGKFTDPQTCN
jgi:hypothetical protein